MSSLFISGFATGEAGGVRLASVQAKSRAWCKDCEAWHPRDEHLVRPEIERPERIEQPERLERPTYLSAEPRERPAPPVRATARRSGWLDFSIFLFVVVPVGAIAWSAAAYTVLWLLPHIKAALT